MATPKLVEQVSEIFQEQLGKSPAIIEKYKSLKAAALERSSGRGNGFAQLEELIKQENLSNEELADISQMIALDSLVLNATRFAIDAKKITPLEEQIKAALRDLRTKGAQDEDIQAGINNMVISLVHTMHPTVYHTPEAKTFEKELTQILEGKEGANATGINIIDGVKSAVQKLGNDPNGFIQKLKEGKASITPQKPISVQAETAMEEENWVEIRKCIAEVVKAWNNATKDTPEFKISPEREQELFQLRTWGKSADADGREKSTAIFLHESIQKALGGRKYNGPILDLRQNAEIHRDFISALIQMEYRHNASDPPRYGETGEFKDFCHNFMRDRAANYNDGKHIWYGDRDSIFQQLTPKDRADFVTEMMKRGDELVPRCVIHDAQEGTRKIHIVKKALVREHESFIRLAGYDPETISYDDMFNVSVPYLKPGEKLDLENKPIYVSLRGIYDAVLKGHGWELYNSGRNFMLLPKPVALGGNEFDFTQLIDPDQMRVTNALQGARKLVVEYDDSGKIKKHEQERLGSEERATLMETIKRLAVIKGAIDKHGAKVADRYQIANFSESADFLTLMKLMQEAELIKIEKGSGTVTRADMDIMPLLETEEDLKNAKGIFENLLNNPCAKSYWEQRGKACIMLGFSDGAASAGNFASQWAIYNATRDLTELFAQHGIKVEFFQGRGRGTDRGGTIDPSLQFKLLPPEVTCQGRYDVTIQSDLPMDMATSPAYGKDYIGKILLGNLKSYVLGKEVRERLSKPETANQREPDQHESIITTIADKASKLYNDLVRRVDERKRGAIPKEEDALTFLNNMPDNPFRSSRATARAGATVFKDFDKVRAIPKEYLANTADLPFHNVGLGQALADNIGDIAKVKDHPFFESILQTVDTGMAHFDAEISSRYGQTTGATEFVAKVNADLEELQKFAQNPLMEKLMPATHQLKRTFGRNDPSSLSSGLDELSHGLILHSLSQGMPPKPDIRQPDQKNWAKTLYNLIFTTAQEVGHRYLQRDRGAGVGGGSPL